MAAVVGLPLCLAFGVASGLGAAAGLYGAVACGILAALFGGTAGQCSGPTGPMTVVAAAILTAESGRPELVFASVIMAGVLQIVIGKLRGGQLVNYMPYPVISGFMTGIGAIIFFIEIPPFLGEDAASGVLNALQSLPFAYQKVNQSCLLLGIFCLAIVYLLPKVFKILPATLVALVAATWLTSHFHLDVPTIGDIPSGLPALKFPQLQFSDLHVVIQNGLTLAILGAIDSLLTSVVLDKVTGRRHDSNQELFGQGLGNIFAGLLGGLPGAGATMRSMVNIKSGGTTYLSGVVHGLMLLFVLLGFSRLAAQIPLCALAAILISVGLSIMDWRVLKRMGRIPRADLLVMLVVLLLTIFVDLIVAVLAGVALASVIFVKQLADAQVSFVGDLENLEILKMHAEHIPESVRKSIFTYQLNGPLFFGEAKNLAAAVDKLAQARYVILRFYNVPLIDQTGAMALESAIENWQAKGVRVLFVGLQKHIIDAIDAFGSEHRIAPEFCFDYFEEAVAYIDKCETAPLEELSPGSIGSKEVEERS